MPVKAMDLFQAYEQSKLPKDKGYVVSSFFSENSAYASYEIVSYAGVKSIYVDGKGMTFQTNGKKLYVLCEPPSYSSKAIEPYVRNELERIPYRFNELNIITAKNQTKIMVAKKPIVSLSSFTIVKPTGINFSIVLYYVGDVLDTLQTFIAKTLNREANIPQPDAKKVGKLVRSTVEETMGAEYS